MRVIDRSYDFFCEHLEHLLPTTMLNQAICFYAQAETPSMEFLRRYGRRRRTVAIGNVWSVPTISINKSRNLFDRSNPPPTTCVDLDYVPGSCTRRNALEVMRIIFLDTLGRWKTVMLMYFEKVFVNYLQVSQICWLRELTVYKIESNLSSIFPFIISKSTQNSLLAVKVKYICRLQ